MNANSFLKAGCEDQRSHASAAHTSIVSIAATECFRAFFAVDESMDDSAPAIFAVVSSSTAMFCVRKHLTKCVSCCYPP